MAESHNYMLILSGLPASGKSTYAREWLAEDPTNRERLNYDDLRIELGVDHSQGFKSKSENAMKDEATTRVTQWLADGKSVIIDNTNLTQAARNKWVSLARQHNTEVEYYHFDTPLHVCIKRDSKRTDRVGRAVIERMALFNGFIDFSVELPGRDAKDIVVCDIDGTLANLDHRLHYVKDGKHDWDRFFAEVDKDKPYNDIISLVKLLHRDHHVIIVSGRSMVCGKATEDWLDQHLGDYDFLFMRQDGDYRPDFIIKQEILDLLPKDRVKFVLDDRDQVVKMWRDNGLRVLQVAEGQF